MKIRLVVGAMRLVDVVVDVVVHRVVVVHPTAGAFVHRISILSIFFLKK
jgi:hypothetical protein|tara:strand:+ start:509 stop:655 length:147 start_codon:yes stop_codon:yes gene_type:complete